MQRMQGVISSARPVRALLGSSGSAMVPRAMAMRSAPPAASVSSINWGSWNAPRVSTGIWISGEAFTRAARWALHPAGRKRLGWVMCSVSLRKEPAETWAMSMRSWISLR